MLVRFFNTYEPVTTFYRDLLPYLAKQNIASEVLISAAEYRQGGREKLSEAISNTKIHFRYLPAFGMQPAGQRQKVGIMLAYVIGSMIITLFGKGVDVNFFLTQPPLFNLWGWVLKVLRRQPYVCLVMDIYPDIAVQDGMMPQNGVGTRLLSQMSRFALKQADAVVAIGRRMAERIREMGVSAERIHFIPNWANPEIIYPIPRERNKLRRELGLPDKFIVLYSGNMGTSHDFNDILDVAWRCQEQTDLHFVFIGGGRRRKEIEAFVNIYELQNVTLLPFQPLERLAESLSLGDVHYISLREGFDGLVVPSKTYGALASGRPVIYSGNSYGEIARLIQEYAVGTVVPPGKPKALEQAIMMYLHNPDLRERQGRKARQIAVREMGKEQALENYITLLQSIN